MNAIIEQDQFLPGLSLPATETFDDWTALGRRLCMSARAVNWLIGDWLIEGSERFGEQAREEAIAIFRSDVQRFDPIVKTCRRFPPDRRHQALTFGHHAAVSEIPEDQAEKLLVEAERERVTVSMLKAQVRVMMDGQSKLIPLDDDDPDDTAMRRMVHAWNLGNRKSRQDFVELIQESDMGVIDL